MLAKLVTQKVLLYDLNHRSFLVTMIFYVMLKLFEPIQMFQTSFSSNRYIDIYLFNSSTLVEKSTAHDYT